MIDDPLLHNGVAADEVVERLGLGSRTVRSKCQIVVLEVQTDTWQIDERLDTSLAKLLGVTY